MNQTLSAGTIQPSDLNPANSINHNTQLQLGTSAVHPRLRKMPCAPLPPMPATRVPRMGVHMKAGRYGVKQTRRRHSSHHSHPIRLSRELTDTRLMTTHNVAGIGMVSGRRAGMRWRSDETMTGTTAHGTEDPMARIKGTTRFLKIVVTKR